MELKYGGGGKSVVVGFPVTGFPFSFLYSETSEQKALELRARLSEKK